jgi:hypothetical protein
LKADALDRRPLNNFIGGVNVKIADENYQVPADAIDALARCLLPAIQSFYESEEGQKEFAEWKSRRDTETEAQSEKRPA